VWCGGLTQWSGVRIIPDTIRRAPPIIPVKRCTTFVTIARNANAQSTCGDTAKVTDGDMRTIMAISRVLIDLEWALSL
jgi:hypothetical protein